MSRKRRRPRILLYDIESAGVNARQSDLGFIIVFGYKWLGEKRAHALTISTSDLRRFDDKRLLIKISALLRKADIVVTHYGAAFDKRFIQGRLLINHLPAFPHPVMRDTCAALRNLARFSSNRLGYVAKVLHFKHQKMENNWPTAWFQIMRGNVKVLRELAEYCKGDVLALEELYLSVRDYVKAWQEK